MSERLICVTGKRASGKSEAGRILAKNHQYEIFDSGPALRVELKRYNRTHDTDLSPQQYIDMMAVKTGNPDWAIEFDADRVIDLTDRVGFGRVALVGYRNFEELHGCTEMIGNKIGAQVFHTILHLESPFDVALARFMKRENITSDDTAIKKLRIQHEFEEEWGIGRMRENADVIIDNSMHGVELLEKRIAHIVETVNLEYTPHGSE